MPPPTLNYEEPEKATPSASDSRIALRVRVAANPPGSNPRVGGPPSSHTPGRCPAVPKHQRSASPTRRHPNEGSGRTTVLPGPVRLAG